MVALRGDENGLRDALNRIHEKVRQGALLRVGFLEDAVYPNGTKVAMVAAIHEFGAPRAAIPPRPFFRPMIRMHRHEWGPALAAQLRATNYDVARSLAALGEGIALQLRRSIAAVTAPPLSPVTLMLRRMKSEDQSLVVTAKTVGIARARVAAGESPGNVPTKPLVDFPIGGHMLGSVDYEVQFG